nr:AAA family ATPase [Dyella sp. RRB7]
MAGDAGLFPIGEVAVVAAPGREGKTFALMAIAAAYARGKRLHGLTPVPDQQAIIYSAEDDRVQYARKLAALRWKHGEVTDGATWWEHIIVPDLESPELVEWRELVKVMDRRPCAGPAVNAIINALQPSMNSSVPPGLLIFETASTLNEADEDNAGLKVLVGALKKIAKALDVAVVLVHHTSQAAGSNLSTLSIGTADIRGATALVYNARQCFLLVNLGSDDNPHPDADARTLLRKMVSPGVPTRVSALICLDSSKALDPPPIYLRWISTPYGPALEEITPPASLSGLRWRKVLAALNGKRAEVREDAKGAKEQAKVAEAVAAVRKLNSKDVPASAKQVSLAAGHTKAWAKPYLDLAEEQGLVTTSMAKIANTGSDTVVYHAKQWADGDSE